jgi:predicted nucleic acid-binding protein
MIVSNATPFVAFARIRQLPLLERVVGDVTIPGAVARELSDYGVERPGGIDLARERWVTVRQVRSEQQVHLLLPTLDQGEAEVIALALETQARLVLMDELTGRKVAQSLDLPVTGTVGILIRAKQLGAITPLRPILEDMKRQGIYFSQRFIDAVMQEVGE